MGEWRNSSIILDLGNRCRCVVSFTTRPLYSRGKVPQNPLGRRLGGVHSRVPSELEKKPLTLKWIETHLPARSPSLYRLSYPGSQDGISAMRNASHSKATFGPTCIMDINRCACKESVCLHNVAQIKRNRAGTKYTAGILPQVRLSLWTPYLVLVPIDRNSDMSSTCLRPRNSMLNCFADASFIYNLLETALLASLLMLIFQLNYRKVTIAKLR
jgi:hypothetical protein